MATSWRGGDEIPAAAVKAVRLTARWGPILAAYWLGRQRGRTEGAIAAAGRVWAARIDQMIIDGRAYREAHERVCPAAQRSLRSGRWL